MVMVMTPPKEQTQVDPATKAGLLPMVVCGAFGIQVPAIAGTHGIGVSTPSAAAVAAATVGLAMLEHIPNGATLTIGTMSVMAAAGRPSIITRLIGSTLRVVGAKPNEHCSRAPVVTEALAMVELLVSAWNP
jgi:hypothetical protein